MPQRLFYEMSKGYFIFIHDGNIQYITIKEIFKKKKLKLSWQFFVTIIFKGKQRNANLLTCISEPSGRMYIIYIH